MDLCLKCLSLKEESNLFMVAMETGHGQHFMFTVFGSLAKFFVDFNEKKNTNLVDKNMQKGLFGFLVRTWTNKDVQNDLYQDGQLKGERQMWK